MIFFSKDHLLLKGKTLKHFIFWSIMLSYYVSSYWPFEDNKIFLLERMLSKIVLQILLSYLTIYISIPLLLNKKKILSFVLISLVLVYVIYVIYTAFGCYYLMPKYPEIYSLRPPYIFSERITNGFAFLRNSTGLIFPTIILIGFNYYQDQKEVLSLREQKKAVELDILKNQLNPHFLFNTLNNLYSLALQKSERTPEIIEKLSEILDYILFRCKDNFVSIKGEVKLMKNYIVLEKLRYGERLSVNVNLDVENDIKIAPLLLLTFLENAFKHGVSEEIGKAEITIWLKSNEEKVHFKLENTKPKFIEKNRNRDSIGLRNIQNQLDILYSGAHELFINDSDTTFSITLNLFPNEI